MVKKPRPASPRTTLGVLGEDPTIGQKTAQGSMRLYMEKNSPRRGLGSPMEKKFGPFCGHVAYSTVSKTNIENLLATTP